MKPKRLKVKETERFYEDFDNTLETIIARLQCELDEGWEGIESEYEQDYGHTRYVVYYLYKYREETDQEYDKRLKLIQKDKEQKREQKIKRLEQLRKEISSMSDEDKKLLGL